MPSWNYCFKNPVQSILIGKNYSLDFKINNLKTLHLLFFLNLPILRYAYQI